MEQEASAPAPEGQTEGRAEVARALYLSMVREVFALTDAPSAVSAEANGASVIASSDAPLRKGNALNEASERASTASPIGGVSVRATRDGLSRLDPESRVPQRGGRAAL